MRNNTTKKLTYSAIGLSIAIILQLIEGMIAIPVPVPGVKLGLANVVALVLIVKVGTKEAVAVNILRVFFAALLRGTIFGPVFYLAFSGAIVSTIALYIAFKTRSFTTYGLSALSAMGHAIGQIVATVWIFGTFGMLYYLPIVMILSIITSVIVGYIAALVVKNTRHIKI